MKKIDVGSRVAYSVQFLRSIFEPPTSPYARLRGTVKLIDKLGDNFLATVHWDGEPDPNINGNDCLDGREYPFRILVDNLAIVGPNHRFCST